MKLKDNSRDKKTWLGLSYNLLSFTLFAREVYRSWQAYQKIGKLSGNQNSVSMTTFLLLSSLTTTSLITAAAKTNFPDNQLINGLNQATQYLNESVTIYLNPYAYLPRKIIYTLSSYASRLFSRLITSQQTEPKEIKIYGFKLKPFEEIAELSHILIQYMGNRTVKKLLQEQSSASSDDLIQQLETASHEQKTLLDEIDTINQSRLTLLSRLRKLFSSYINKSCILYKTKTDQHPLTVDEALSALQGGEVIHIRNKRGKKVEDDDVWAAHYTFLSSKVLNETLAKLKDVSSTINNLMSQLQLQFSNALFGVNNTSTDNPVNETLNNLLPPPIPPAPPAPPVKLAAPPIQAQNNQQMQNNNQQRFFVAHRVGESNLGDYFNVALAVAQNGGSKKEQLAAQNANRPKL